MLEPMRKLAVVLARLPGVGRRSAERIVLRLARERNGLARDLASALQTFTEQVEICSLCGAPTLRENDPCLLCADANRDKRLLCVVEDPGDIFLIERAGEYRGRYHALMGKLSPMRGEGRHNLRVDELLRRVDSEKPQEVILALNSDVEGEATAAYLTHLLADRPVRVTRLAAGIPAGSGIAYADPLTLARAFQGRRAP